MAGCGSASRRGRQRRRRRSPAACGWRTRDHAVEALRHEGFEAEAARLDVCADLEAVTAAGQEVAARLDGEPARYAARAAANSIAARAPRTGITAHLTAVVAAEARLLTGQAPTFDDGFQMERAWQADWLATNLALDNPPVPPDEVR